MKAKRIYFDTASTTPLDKRVKKAMEKFWQAEAGNPASLYQEGVKAKEAVEEARKKVAVFLGAHPDEIIFTSGGTEGNNLALFGVASAYGQGGHLIVSAIEHKSVLEPAQELDRRGMRVTYLPVDQAGFVNLKSLKENLSSDTFLVSVILANNEIGTVQPVKEIARIIRHFKKENNSVYPYLHVDACQAPRFLPLLVDSLGVDLMTLNGSKIYGPKGVGALYVKRKIKIRPLLWGGGQEGGLRSGTSNVPSIMGFAEALKICGEEREKESRKLSGLRDYLAEELKKNFSGIKINGSLENRLPNNLNFSLPDLEGEQMVLELDAKGFAVSTGSACSSASETTSHVLRAIGAGEKGTFSSLRISLGRDNTRKEIDNFVLSLKKIIDKLSLVKGFNLGMKK